MYEITVFLIKDVDSQQSTVSRLRVIVDINFIYSTKYI